MYCIRGLMLCLAVTGARADILWLTNGDIISGSLMYADNKTIEFDSIAAGRLAIPWNQIQSLETKAEVRFVLRGSHDVLTSRLEKGKNGQVILNDGSEIMLSSIESLTRLKSYIQDWTWNGNFDLSMEIKENQDDDIEEFRGKLNSNVFNTYWRHTLKADIEYKTEDDVETDNNFGIEYSIDYFIDRPLFLRGRGRFERDYFSENQKSGEYSLGAGYQFYDTEQTQFFITAEVSRTRFTYNLVFDNFIQIPLVFEFNSAGIGWDFKQNISGLQLEVFTFGDVFHPFHINVDYIFHSESGIRHYLTSLITLSLRVELDQYKTFGEIAQSQRFLLGMGVNW